MTSDIPIIDPGETKDVKNAWIDKLPVCQLCGQKSLDYVTVYDDKGDILHRSCTKHHDPKDPYHAQLISAII